MDLQLGYVECSQLSHEMMWTDTELMNLIKNPQYFRVVIPPQVNCMKTTRLKKMPTSSLEFMVGVSCLEAGHT